MTLMLSDPDLFRTQAYIDGQWVDADSGETFAVIDPATGEEIAQVPRMGAAETRRAIEAAERAQVGWRKLLAKERAKILRDLADAMLANADDLATILTAEQGKPHAEAKAEIIDDLPADWPKLSPAGVQPVTDENSALQRDHV